MSYDKKLLQLTIVTTHKQTKASLIAHSPKCVVPVSLSAFRENRKHGCNYRRRILAYVFFFHV